MIRYGAKVRSMRDKRIVGTVVGFGTIMWPRDEYEMLNEDDKPQAVYLVQIAQGSSSLGPACAVLRADMVEEV